MQQQYAVQALIFYSVFPLQWVVFVAVDCEMFLIHIFFAQSEFALSVYLFNHLYEATTRYSRVPTLTLLL